MGRQEISEEQYQEFRSWMIKGIRGLEYEQRVDEEGMVRYQTLFHGSGDYDRVQIFAGRPRSYDGTSFTENPWYTINYGDRYASMVEDMIRASEEQAQGIQTPTT